MAALYWGAGKIFHSVLLERKGNWSIFIKWLSAENEVWLAEVQKEYCYIAKRHYDLNTYIDFNMQNWFFIMYC